MDPHEDHPSEPAGFHDAIRKIIEKFKQQCEGDPKTISLGCSACKAFPCRRPYIKCPYYDTPYYKSLLAEKEKEEQRGAKMPNKEE